MRLSNRCFPALCSSAPVLLLTLALPAQPVPHATPHSYTSGSQQASLESSRQLSHRSPEWTTIEQHLPDPATASASQLETQADILRARRFPEDALLYYNYALGRGSSPETIYKKVGIIHVELRNIVLAQLYFERALKLDPHDAEAWNDLGAVAYMSHQYGSAIGAYKKSVKLDRKAAVYHSNLGMAYFDQKDYKKARREIATALKLDPEIFRKTSSTGVSAHVLSPEDRARFCLEMAKNYAQQMNEEEMMHALSMAGEAGMNLEVEMAHDKILALYRNDPRVLLLIQNLRALHAQQNGLAQVGPAPPIPRATATTE